MERLPHDVGMEEAGAEGLLSAAKQVNAISTTLIEFATLDDTPISIKEGQGLLVDVAEGIAYYAGHHFCIRPSEYLLLL